MHDFKLTLDLLIRSAKLANALIAERDTARGERDSLLRVVTENHVALQRAEAAEAERDALAQKRNDAERVAGALTLENEALQADNARLRAELTKAADSLDWADVHLETLGAVSTNIRYGARDARAAINGEETK